MYLFQLRVGGAPALSVVVIHLKEVRIRAVSAVGC